jgi:uncharacterized protein (TIGR03083 family)
MARLTPRYDMGAVVALDGAPDAIRVPSVRQRRRLLDTVAEFSDDEWRHPSRCAAWTSRDVIAHLDSTNGFWTAAIAAGVAGEPTRLLATFDPVATPAQLVDATAARSNAEVLERFAASTDALADQVSSLDDDGWSAIAEAPPGHVRVCDLMHHALWDSWVHERDILLPIGIEPERHGDEITACLRYAIALTASFGIAGNESRAGTISLAVTDPTIDAVAEVDGIVSVRAGRLDGADVTLTGDAVEVLEALSIRAPLAATVPADAAWLLDGLATVFDVGDR